MWQPEFLQVTTVSARQHGLITAAQADRLGVQLSPLAGDGLLTLLDWDVYHVAGTPQDATRDYLRAAWLALVPDQFAWERAQDAVVSHTSAARLLGLCAATAPVITFTAEQSRAMPRATRLSLGTFDPDEVVVLEGLPVTSALRTVLDLVAAGTDAGELRQILSTAVRTDRIDLTVLYRQLAPAAERFGLPADGPSFVGEFLEALDGELSPRNQRALATLALPSEVERVTTALQAALEGVDQEILAGLAAEVVYRSRAH
ncbi:hypothetical protein [Kribbella italica]|uniref:AbiEi antitoxin C-terminal domain-containing protein n=1 Tax=Kribbella italica TaxID=1540520 RepID=A0A7W9JDE1_9ACTN|nr:hypothetical protein [Kribbella italica]MBB5840109.1 hypothetical protein [Kribbella italica]